MRAARVRALVRRRLAQLPLFGSAHCVCSLLLVSALIPLPQTTQHAIQSAQQRQQQQRTVLAVAVHRQLAICANGSSRHQRPLGHAARITVDRA